MPPAPGVQSTSAATAAHDGGAAGASAVDPSAAAIHSYRRRLRRWRVAYAATLALILIVAFAVVRVAYSAGELSHTSLRPAKAAAPEITTSAPSAAPRLAWRTTDAAARGTPYYRGTVVTSDRHTVRGRNGLTGAVRWSYTRTDRTVCAAVQDGAVTIAVYRLAGNCDELTALNTATGRLNWTRTMDKDGAGFDGPASYVVTPDAVLFVSPTALYAIDPSGTTATQGGLDRWTFSHPGCRITSATLGSSGALISQTCTGEDCSSSAAKYCGDGPQLLLRQASAGNNTDSTTNHKNPDQVIWNDKGSRSRAATAGAVVTAFRPGGRVLDVLSAEHGARLGQVRIGSASGQPSSSTPVADGELLWTGGVAYAVDADGRIRWSRATAGLPVASVAGTDTFDRSQFTAVARGAVVTVSGRTGDLLRRYPIDDAAAQQAWPYGSGFLVAGAGTAMYR